MTTQRGQGPGWERLYMPRAQPTQPSPVPGTPPALLPKVETPQVRPRFVDVTLDMGAAPVRSNAVDYFLRYMVDARRAHRLVILIDNSLNQPTSVRIVGAMADLPEASDRHFQIGDVVVIAGGDRTTVTVDLTRYWHPFIGVAIMADTSVTSPTSGEVRAEAHMVNEG